MDRFLIIGRRALLAAVLPFALMAGAHASNADHGKELFSEKCSLCHTANSGGANKLGPNLFGVVGRHSGSLGNFNYSSAMRTANKVWDQQTLEAYLAGPQKLIPGIRMTFPGFPNPADAQDVIAYLSSQK
ncbi:MAG TPA: cytochrome c family protein [Rhizomicrobium sp.]|jgi:cytochrome c|nr:cytochrome c family protein [Rhizomicrobium sp.]